MEKIERKEGDFVLVLLIALLVGIGIAVLFSASYFHAERLDKDPGYFFRKQLIYIGLGIVVGFILSRTPLELIKKFVPFILLSALVVSLLTFVPGIGKPILGARRWIFIGGSSFQPSEYIKVALVVYLSHIFSKKQDMINDPLRAVLPPLIVVAIFTGIIYFQNDFSTAFFIFFISLSIFFIARVRVIYFFMLGTIIIPLGGVLLFTKVYWVKKLMVFFNIDTDPSGTGYQVLQSKGAFVNGGLWGQGLGNGMKKLGGLPEADSDFIFAVIGEEMGFIGSLFILFLYIFFAYRGYLVSLKTEDSFKYYLSFGITTIIFFQALLNIAVVLGLIPATGIPLPFFSNGGTSMLMNLIMCGLLFNVSRKEKYIRRAELG